MCIDKIIRENTFGKYLFIEAEYFNEGIEYAHKIKITQIQLRGILGKEGISIDFSKLEKLSDHLLTISFQMYSFVNNKISNVSIKDITKFESIYSLTSLENILTDCMQKFTIDISRFPNLKHFGGEYWKGLINLDKAYSLNSLVIIKLPDADLKRISGLINLKILHVYSSKITTLNGIECLPIEYIYIARNSNLVNITAIEKLKMLNRLEIAKCKNINDENHLIDSIRNRVMVRIIH